MAAGLHVVAADSERAMTSADLTRLAESGLDMPVADRGTVAEGLEAALATGEPVLVTGSMYVAGEARIARGLA